MATVTISYATSATISCNCTGMASSSFTSGYESAWVDNTTTKYVDALLSGKAAVGKTAPTVNTQILVYTVGMLDDSTYPDVFDGTEGAETLTNMAVVSGAMKLAAVMPVLQNTTSIPYYFGPVSVAQLYGGAMPHKWGLYVTHNTAQNLSTVAGDFAFSYKGVKYDVA